MNMRIATYILALIFFASGAAKLAALPFEVEAFARWGYPPAFMYLTGVIEVIAALGLLIPRLSALVSLCMAAFMLGAIGTHLMHAEWGMLVLATGIAALAAWRGWSGRCEIRRLLGRTSP